MSDLCTMLDTVFVKVEDLRILPWLSLLKWMLMSKMFIERLRLKVSGCALKGLLEPELNRKWGISVMVIINLFKNCFDTCLFTDIWLAKYVLICKHADDYWFQRVKLKMCTSGLTFFFVVVVKRVHLCGVEGSNLYMCVIKKNRSKTDHLVNLIRYPCLLIFGNKSSFLRISINIKLLHLVP